MKVYGIILDGQCKYIFKREMDAQDTLEYIDLQFIPHKSSVSFIEEFEVLEKPEEINLYRFLSSLELDFYLITKDVAKIYNLGIVHLKGLDIDLHLEDHVVNHTLGSFRKYIINRRTK